MIRARHTIMLPGRVLAPGDTAELSTAEEARLVAGGFAMSAAGEAVPQGEPPVAPADPNVGGAFRRGDSEEPQAARQEPKGSRHK